MIFQKEMTLPPYSRGFYLITEHVQNALSELPQTGLLNVFIKHTSAGLTINENADDTVRIDFESYFNKIVPENEPFIQHDIEGPDDMPAHIKASLVGSSITIPITKGQLNLGTWQGIYLCEFRNMIHRRRLVLTVYG